MLPWRIPASVEFSRYVEVDRSSLDVECMFDLLWDEDSS